MYQSIKEMDKKAILEIRHASYCYEGEKLPVWEHLSCRFFEGKIHVVTGPSGCGKTSVLYLLDGLIPHVYEGKVEGEVLLDGTDITAVPPRERCGSMGFVMQNPESQFCTFTVEEELAFGMENMGMDPEIMSVRIKEALEFVGMPGYEKTELVHLSGGEKQKIAIASLIVMKPRILLLDEPTANLDPKSRKQIFNLIVRLSRKEGMTIVLVEHNIEEIKEEVDYFVSLDRNGNVIDNAKRIRGDDGEKRKETFFFEQRGKQHKESGETKEEVLKIEDLYFSYSSPGKKEKTKKKEILNGLNLTVRNGEFVAIVGENGVGKTTLMRLIFRICIHDRGKITLFGKPVEAYRKKDLYHMIGLVFQNPESQFVKNTVYDELMFSLKKVKISQKEKEERVSEMLKRFHLEKEKDKSPFVLSQGQKRRLSVADMLLTHQKILFLDEPTYGQDFENRQELMKDMRRLTEEGITIVMITHDLELVRQYAKRVVEIGQGRVQCDLSTGEYFAWKEKGGADRCLTI